MNNENNDFLIPPSQEDFKGLVLGELHHQTRQIKTLDTSVERLKDNLGDLKDNFALLKESLSGLRYDAVTVEREIARHTKALETAFDRNEKAFGDISKEVSTLRSSVEVLRVRAGVWGAVAALVMTILIALMPIAYDALKPKPTAVQQHHQVQPTPDRR